MKSVAWFMLFFLVFAYILKAEWKNVHYEQFQKVQSMKCIDSNNYYSIANHTGLIAEEAGFRVYKSSDIGRNWELIYKALNVYQQEEPQVLNVRDGLVPQLGYIFIASEDNPIILKSADSGKTFKKIILQVDAQGTDNILRSFAMCDTNYGFVCNSNSYFTTKDGWESFEQYPKLNSAQTYYSPVFLDSNTVVMTYHANYRWNDNKGLAFIKYQLNENKWDTLSFFWRDSIYGDHVEKLFFFNDTLGYGCGTRFYSEEGKVNDDIIVRTTDGGHNWEVVLSKPQIPQVGLWDISFHDEKNGIAVGFYGKIAMTNDGGDTWVYEELPNEMDNARKMLVCWAGRTPIIGTWDAGIFRYEGDFFDFTPDTTDTTDVKEYVRDILGDIEIHVQHYNSRLYISLEDPHFRKYQLQIADIMGNIVHSEELNSGIGTLYLPVDISGLTNGVYLYMISTQGVIAKTGSFCNY